MKFLAFILCFATPVIIALPLAHIIAALPAPSWLSGVVTGAIFAACMFMPAPIVAGRDEALFPYWVAIVIWAILFVLLLGFVSAIGTAIDFDFGMTGGTAGYPLLGLFGTALLIGQASKRIP